MAQDSRFHILIASPPEYGRLVAEIHYDGKFFALINQERGDGQFDLETAGIGLAEDAVVRRVDIAGFIAAVELACNRLVRGD